MKTILLQELTVGELKSFIREAVRDILSELQNQKEKKPEKLISRKEASDLLGISLVTLHSWTRTQRIQGYRINSRVFLLMSFTTLRPGFLRTIF